jgi:hypothetical protein
MMIGEMAAAMDGGWGAYTPDGKCIWVRLRQTENEGVDDTLLAPSLPSAGDEIGCPDNAAS